MSSFIRSTLIALAILSPAGVCAGEYRDAKPKKPIFDHNQLGLMNIEREKLASELAAYVSNELGRGPKAESGDASNRMDLASRMLAVALQLHPRNRTALVANFKLGRGLATEFATADYEPGVLAEYLYTRSKLLVEQGGLPNEVLATYLLAFAVEIDPTNEDAIFDLEIRDLDGKAPDWNLLVPGLRPPSEKKAPPENGSGSANGNGAKAPKSEPAPAPAPAKKEVPKPGFKGWPLGENGKGGLKITD